MVRGHAYDVSGNETTVTGTGTSHSNLKHKVIRTREHVHVPCMDTETSGVGLMNKSRLKLTMVEKSTGLVGALGVLALLFGSLGHGSREHHHAAPGAERGRSISFGIRHQHHVDCRLE